MPTGWSTAAKPIRRWRTPTVIPTTTAWRCATAAIRLSGSDTPENNHLNNGDVNGMGGVNAADVLLATRIVLNLYTPTDEEKVRADMVPDEVINAGDLVRIQHAAMGM